MGALRRWWPLLAVATLLVAAAATAALSALPIGRIQAGQPEQVSSAAPARPDESMASVAPNTEQAASSMPGWLTPALLVTGIVVAAVIIWTVLASAARLSTRFRRRAIRERPAVRVAQLRAEEEVVKALDAGLLDLDDADADPRTAVIACWVRLEQAAAAAGTARLPGDTATDLVVRMLAGHALAEGVLTGFADVYRRARYATHAVDASMREQARSALHRLRAELTGVAV